jgi:hypothetical protein
MAPMSSDDDASGATLSIKLPDRSLWLAVASAFTGCMVIGAALYQSATEATAANAAVRAERAESIAADALSISTATALQASTNAGAIEQLRIDLLQKTFDRYSKSQANEINEKQDREHELFERELNQHGKEIDALRRAIR